MVSEGVLLDTCIVLDHLQGVLDSGIRKRLDEQPKRYVSVVCAWEIELRPVLRNNISQEKLGDAFRDMGVRVLPITMSDVSTLRRVERFHDHRDPFDRLLIAQAFSHNLAISTYDLKFSRYDGLELL